MRESTLRRLGLAFRIGWFLRGLPIALVLVGACAPVRRCEFPLWVTVTPNADEECRALPVPPKWTDSGRAIHDTDHLRGCAPEGRIITNGEWGNGGHELRHAIEQNCRSEK